MEILKFTETFEYYVAREWNGWLSGWQIVQLFNAAQNKFGSDNKNVQRFGSKYIAKGVAGEVEDCYKLGLTDEEMIETLDNETHKTIAKMLRH